MFLAMGQCSCVGKKVNSFFSIMFTVFIVIYLFNLIFEFKENLQLVHTQILDKNKSLRQLQVIKIRIFGRFSCESR